MLGDLISASYTEVDSTFTDKGGDIGGGEEDEGYGVVFDEGDVEAGFAAELNIGTSEKVESGLLETSLWSKADEWGGPVEDEGDYSLFGTAKRRRPSRLGAESVPCN